MPVMAIGFLPIHPTSTVMAQDMSDDMVGQSEQAWRVWTKAMNAFARDQADDANAALDEIAQMDLSPLRLALMGDRSGTLRFEQAVVTGTAGPSGQDIWIKIEAGRRQKMLAEDGWHFAQIGRFSYADANFKALIESSPDPVALLELARYNRTRHTILIKLLSNTEVGPSAHAFLQVLAQGEDMLRQDPIEISANIEKLGGTPRMAFNATNGLKASGEYAVPHLVRYLRDPQKGNLRAPIIKLLPDLGREALNPLVIALTVDDQVVKQTLIEALGKIGYRQALPYLARIAQDSDSGVSTEVANAAREAMSRIDPSVAASVATFFVDLAEAYHANMDSVRADERVTTANVWYWRDDKLVYIPVPREIFNDIMAMRCCEEALSADEGTTQAAALWLASNFRREAKLGMDVESEAPDIAAMRDRTRPEGYPRSIYFARAAGPLHNHLVLQRAVRDRDPGPALGGIAALAVTAGASSMVGVEDAKQALIDCLTFPHRLVRIKAGLAIGRTLPISGFDRSHQVIPVLSEALQLSSTKTAIIVESDDQNRNKLLAIARAGGMEAVAAPNLYAAMEAARAQQLTFFDVIILGSDIADPNISAAVSELRGDFSTAATPIIILTKEGDTSAAQQLRSTQRGVEMMLSGQIEGGTPEAAAEAIVMRYSMAAQKLGMRAIDGDLALGLAMEATEVLRMLAVNGATVLDYSRAEPALIRAMNGDEQALRIASANVLALINTPTAQEAIAEAAMNADNNEAMRLAAFSSLAESARRNGNRLSETIVQQVVALATQGGDLVMRTAASKALGAMDMPSSNITGIIQAQSRN
jgi:HEAT repeat protein